MPIVIINSFGMRNSSGVLGKIDFKLEMEEMLKCPQTIQTALMRQARAEQPTTAKRQAKPI
ncbi:hypothetical protein PghCCS26_48810 [Paenibacillus glycanilyticus]|uniref:Uncharacterized protein n=1 Tax=Paenibacillus glycanilyticus TaxID=126569 RepID=A0ABQ6NRL1_9BACL|nr:hypothetical protein PghCCS26_48810 [Paenibacillus glycanilyticus]